MTAPSCQLSWRVSRLSCSRGEERCPKLTLVASDKVDRSSLFILWKWNLFSHVRLFVTPLTVACQAPLSMDSSGKNTGVGSCSLLQEIFPTQVSCIAGGILSSLSQLSHPTGWLMNDSSHTHSLPHAKDSASHPMHQKQAPSNLCFNLQMQIH